MLHAPELCSLWVSLYFFISNVTYIISRDILIHITDNVHVIKIGASPTYTWEQLLRKHNT